MNPTQSRILPFIILAVFLILTAFATEYVWETSQLTDRAAFDNATQATRDAIQYRVDAYTDILTSASGLFVADDNVERQEFRAFVGHLNLPQRYPGVLGLGLALRIPNDLRDSTIDEIRKSGVNDFHIWPAGTRSEYAPVVMIEPMEGRNRRAIGYDMASSVPRREAMERARDTAASAQRHRVSVREQASDSARCAREPDHRLHPERPFLRPRIHLCIRVHILDS